MASAQETLDRPTAAGGDWLDTLTGPIARWAFALLFIGFGVNHFVFTDAMAGMVPLPGEVFWVYLTGAAMIAAGISFATKTAVKWAGIGLAALLMGFVAMIHLPGALEAGSLPNAAVTNGMKDMALAAGALIVAGRWGS